MAVHYETLFICQPELSDEDVQKIVAKTKDFIQKNEGKIVQEELVGRRHLAYPIRKKREGFYVRLEFEASSKLPALLDYNFRIQEQILRSMVLRQEK